MRKLVTRGSLILLLGLGIAFAPESSTDAMATDAIGNNGLGQPEQVRHMDSTEAQPGLARTPDVSYASIGHIWAWIVKTFGGPYDDSCNCNGGGGVRG